MGFEILSTIIQGGKFYKKDPRYSLQLLNYIIPGKPIGSTHRPSVKRKKRSKSTNDLYVDSSEDEDVQAESYAMDNQDGCTEEDTQIISHMADGKQQQKLYHEQFEHFRRGVFLKLLFRKGENDGIEERGEVILGLESEIVVNNVVIKFSNDSRFLAIFMKERNAIKVLEIDQKVEECKVPIEEACKKLERRDYYFEYPQASYSVAKEHLIFPITF